MKKHSALLLTFAHAMLFVFLFYKQQIGLNLFIFEVFAISTLLFIQKKKPVNSVSKIVLIGTLLSGAFVVIIYSAFAIFINICSFLLFTGVMVYPEAKSVATSAALTVTNFFQAHGSFFHNISLLKGETKSLRWTFKFFKIAIIPLIVVWIFILIYKNANPIFAIALTKLNDFFSPIFKVFFINLDISLLLVFLLGIVISTITFFQVKNNYVIEIEKQANDNKPRKRQNIYSTFYKTLSLKNELKSAVLLLTLLNTLILFVNIIDIYWVWINFEWEGEYLKQFVHEGTYLLILSILLSMAIVLYYFRGNLNFYKKNKGLKLLSTVWLAQNAILVISVAIRNFWYIKYFALAYKRIGVLFFLIATLYGIYTIYMKISKKKSIFYLIRKNIIAIYCILIFMTFFNWDVIIARYNFKHYDTAFVHLSFLSNLSNKALPYIDKSYKELIEIQKAQKILFPFEQEFMSIEAYHKKIQEKKEKFMTQWDKKNIKSWNIAENKTYIILKDLK